MYVVLVALKFIYFVCLSKPVFDYSKELSVDFFSVSFLSIFLRFLLVCSFTHSYPIFSFLFLPFPPVSLISLDSLFALFGPFSSLCSLILFLLSVSYHKIWKQSLFRISSELENQSDWIEKVMPHIRTPAHQCVELRKRLLDSLCRCLSLCLYLCVCVYFVLLSIHFGYICLLKNSQK